MPVGRFAATRVLRTSLERQSVSSFLITPMYEGIHCRQTFKDEHGAKNEYVTGDICVNDVELGKLSRAPQKSLAKSHSRGLR